MKAQKEFLNSNASSICRHKYSCKRVTYSILPQYLWSQWKRITCMSI